MKAKLIKIILTFLGIYTMLQSDEEKTASILQLATDIIHIMRLKATKDKTPKQKEYIREYTKDTKKHNKGVITVILEKNITNQLAFRGIDTNAVIKELNANKVYECKANSSKYYLKA